MEFVQLSSSVVLLLACICCVPVSCGESSTSTPPPHQACSSITGSCEECLKNVSCLWCYTTNACLDYPVRNILPPSKLCRLSDARWGVCWVNFEALIIAMAVVGGILLISITICCCCCCCRKRSSGPDRDEERMARRREERMQRSDERKSERKTKHDEIRKKYGLLSKSDHPYSRFEND